MDPLIKWPGGKKRDIDQIKKFIPKFNRYFEPFFGGGAVGFFINPQVGFANDIDNQLIDFYRNVSSQNIEFKTQIYSIYNDWGKINQVSTLLSADFATIFPDSLDKLKDINYERSINQIWEKYSDKISNILESLETVKLTLFQKYLLNSLMSKSGRIKKLQIKHHKLFQDDLLNDHLLTAVKSAYYTYIRDEKYNSDSNSAIFYFIREFCYGSMFRYNSKGEFNIPYGGINYNKKDFMLKIERLFSTKVQEIISKFKFFNLDFIEFLDKFEFSRNDFIFLDPPYDSDFKKYGNYPFSASEQENLANYLTSCNAKWMLVIQKTELIKNLYLKANSINPNIELTEYDKTYTYNVRGRNDRDASHYIIKNY